MRSRRRPRPCGLRCCASRSSRSRATRSTTFDASPPRRRRPTRSARTAFTAHSTFRPRCCAMASLNDAVKFSTFFPIVPGMSSPCPPTGCAAPMLVPGAIAATCAAIVMKTPGRAGAGAARRDVDDDRQRRARGCPSRSSRADCSSPPGVSSSITSAAAPSAARACDRLARRTRATAGLIAAVDHDAREHRRRRRPVASARASNGDASPHGDAAARAHLTCAATGQAEALASPSGCPPTRAACRPGCAAGRRDGTSASA